jgi:hypothetical protein
MPSKDIKAKVEREFNNEVKPVFEVKRDFDYRVENRLTSCQIERPKIELYNVTCTKTPSIETAFGGCLALKAGSPEP